MSSDPAVDEKEPEGSTSTTELPQRKQCLELLAKLKAEAKDLVANQDKDDIKQKTTRMMRDMLTLKRLNRQIFEALAAERQTLESLKTKTALFHLDLQNTNYERTHLKREIPKHRDFPTPELNKIDLVDEETFKAKQDGTVFADAHELQLARLADELETRQSLSKNITSLEASKRAAIDKLTSTAATVDSIPELVQSVEDAAHPISELVEFKDDDAE